MNIRKNASQICTTLIFIEPYLAEYCRNLYSCGRKDGAVRIPYTSDLYHLVWEQMSKRPDGYQSPAAGNLCILLPTSRECDDDSRKNPLYYNYLSDRAVRMIERWLYRAFNFEFHGVMMENEHCGRPMTHLELVRQFIRQHGLKSITEDALIKNFQRYRRHIFPKKVRKYKKTLKFKKI